MPGLSELEPPLRRRGRPEAACGIDDRRGDLLRRQRRKFAGKFARHLVPGDIGTAIGRQDGVIHVDQHGARELRHGLTAKNLNQKPFSRTWKRCRCHRSFGGIAGAGPWRFTLAFCFGVLPWLFLPALLLFSWAVHPRPSLPLLPRPRRRRL